MKSWLRGKTGGLVGFVVVAGLLVGGLGWATAAALRLEREQLAERADAERAGLMRRALWRMDSWAWPLLARENDRPFNHYSAVFAPPLALYNSDDARAVAFGSVLEPSPLLHAELPAWMRLHFQVDAGGWESPQAPPPQVMRFLNSRPSKHVAACAAAHRGELERLTRALPVPELLALARERALPTLLPSPRPAEPGFDPSAVVRTVPQTDAQAPNVGNYLGNAANPDNFSYGQQGLAPNQAPEFLVRQNVQNRIQNEGRTQSQRMAREAAQGNLFGRNGQWLLDNANNRDQGPQQPNAPAGQPAASKGAVGPPRPPDAAPTAPPAKPPPSKPDPSIPVNPKKEALGLEIDVNLGPLTALWATTHSGDELLLLRLIQIDHREIVQGVELDAPQLQELLAAEVQDLFPGGTVVPARGEEAQPERTMTALPLQLDPGPPPPPPDPGWTTLRVGLALAWAAALVALGAVGLGGWSLLDLSERRIRFVSAVTHELRTPLTTLRLYLDMLLNGLVRDEKQREEYLHTLSTEAERLTRLVGNVLDFSRLERRSPPREAAPIAATALLEQVRSVWQSRCTDADKELLVEDLAGPETVVRTDAVLAAQLLGNLIDNACKYSRGADDRRVWLRARVERGRLCLDVEDRGPGVPVRERRAIFRPFRRGRRVDATGGVGLGLALARNWARLLGGRLTLLPPSPQGGACFQLTLPL
jgi:signal transduction histidine kinase